MNFIPTEPPRSFGVGIDKKIRIKECARIQLGDNEQVTFETESGLEYDIVRKEWGYYATPSLNGRLKRFNLRAVLVRSPSNKYFILLVEEGKEQAFQEYLDAENDVIISWLDNDRSLEAFEQKSKDTNGTSRE